MYMPANSVANWAHIMTLEGKRCVVVVVVGEKDGRIVLVVVFFVSGRSVDGGLSVGY